MRLNTAANLAATAALLIVGVHLLSFEMSPEREDLDSKQLRARINSVRAQADETRQLIAAMRQQAVVEATPAPVALPRRRPPPNARRMRADTSKLNTVVLAVMAHDREASLRDCLRAVLTSSGATQLLRVGVSMDAPYAYAALRAEAQQAAKAYDMCALIAGSTPMRHDPKPQESSRARRNQKSRSTSTRRWWRGSGSTVRGTLFYWRMTCELRRIFLRL